MTSVLEFIWHWFVITLKAYPEIAIFLSLAGGFFIGKLNFRGVGLGSVAATLIVALIVGQLDVKISTDVKSVFFLMFLFALGFSVGPQFVRGVAKNGLPQAIYAIIVCILSLGTVVVVAKLAGFEIGEAAGIFAGAYTISSALPLAIDAIEHLPMSTERMQTIANSVPTVFAMTYIFGTIGTTLILAFVAPKLLGINLAAVCKDYEKRMGGAGEDADTPHAWHRFVARAYRIDPGTKIAGKTVAEAEALFPSSRIFIERLRRGDEILDVDGSTILQAGDIIAASGGRKELLQFLGHEAQEIDDPELLNVPVSGVDIVITNRKMDGKTLAELAKLPSARGIFLRRIRRGATGVQIPILPTTEIHRGDVVTVIGWSQSIARASKIFGVADRVSDQTDMVSVASAIVLGALIGSLVVHAGMAPLTLSSSGGVLLAGIIFGWLRSVHPTFGQIPSAAIWFMNNVGLTVFIAVVGLSSGPGFMAGAKELGLSVFAWGALVTTLPLIISLYIGKYIFRFDDALLLGCCAGARGSTASLSLITQVAKSQVPALGFSVTCAVGNTLLTVGGTVIVLLLS
ncbi:aspartate-alanine antiporter [Falsochrobactrum ovis]|uniref:Putative transport protein n=1 Tax=Falsochrobactrum ovis TaxID=1293442 RepID=A0A364JS68_9HYPH|nr:aspartate-alanine antiporter [Falsochrobactrum ovis]RAK25790.1 putative transport protein [Falsochrobactrum ovis]